MTIETLSNIGDIGSLSTNFPPTMPFEIPRDNIVNTLRTLLQDKVYAVSVEGVEGMGKTTVLSQFARSTPGTISIFVSGANRLSFDPDLIRIDLARQVFWSATGNSDLQSSCDPQLLRSYYGNLQRKAKQARILIHFVIDGTDELEARDREATIQLFSDLLPVGVPQFRFLFSGDESLYRTLVKSPNVLKACPLTEFSMEETRTLLASRDLSLEQLRGLHRLCRGIPARLTSVLRAVDNGTQLDNLLSDSPAEWPEFFEIDWRQVPEDDEQTKLILALLAHDPKPHTVSNVSKILTLEPESIRVRLAQLPFIAIDALTGQIRFASTGLQRFAAARLAPLKSAIQKRLIKYLRTIPDSEEFVLQLPAYLEEASQFHDLFGLLTPEHILHVLERSQTLTGVEDVVSRGLRSAKKLGKDAEFLRFCIQKSIISELMASSFWDTEVDALAAVGRDSEALALANNAVLREDRLRLVIGVAHGIWLRTDNVPPDLLGRIGRLIETLDVRTLGRLAPSLTARLNCLSPDLAMSLQQKAFPETDRQPDIDYSFLRVGMAAATEIKDDHRRDQVLEAMTTGRKDPRVVSVLQSVRVLSGRLSPSGVCDRLSEIETTEAKVTVARHWCILNGSTPDADLVARSGLATALQATSFTIDASLLADFSQALQGAPTHTRRVQLISEIDSLRGTAERQGPSVDYVRLQLTISSNEIVYDAAAAEGRIMELLDFVARIIDMPARGECYARCLATMRTLKVNERFVSKDSLPSHCLRELESVVLQLAYGTADHCLALGGIIVALADGCLDKALEYTRVVNTERRRDTILRDIVEELVRRSVSDIPLSDLKRIVSEIRDIDLRDSTIESVLERFSDESALPASVLSGLMPFMDMSTKIVETMLACRTLVHSINILARNGGPKSNSFQERLLSALLDRFDKIDVGWLRIDAGFGIAKDLSGTLPHIASEIISKAEELKQECGISAYRLADVYISSLALVIRAFCGLIPKHLETIEDIKAISVLIELLPSYGERAIIWADLCVRCIQLERMDLAENLVNKHLNPALSKIHSQDARYRASVLVRTAAAVYRVQPQVCLSTLDTLDPDIRDHALRRICRFLVSGKLPSSKEDSGTFFDTELTYDNLLKTVALVEKIDIDWMISAISQDVAEALESPKNRFSINQPQREKIASRFEAIAHQKLPIARHITHPGYQIVTLANAFRIRQAKVDEWAKLIERARALDNIADRALVLHLVAICLPSNMRSHYDKLRAEAQNCAAAIPSTIDQAERYIGFAEDLNTKDTAGCKEMIRLALIAVRGSSGNIHEQRRRLLDVAFNADAAFAKLLIEQFDDDEAKNAARAQLRLLERRRDIKEDSSPETPPPQIHGRELSEFGWYLVRSLNSGRLQNFHPSDIRSYAELASEHPLLRSFPVLVWYVENCVARFAKTDQANTLLRPVFDACVVGAELAGRVAGRTLSRLKSLKKQSTVLSGIDPLFVTAGTKEEAQAIIAQWFQEHPSDLVKIADPYFSPSDLPWLQLIRSVHDECTFTILAARKNQPKLDQDQDFVDLYTAAWRRLYDQAPPRTEIVIIGGEVTRDSPIHDRWVVTKSGGLRLGTSLNSLGISKDSEISEITSEQSERFLLQIDQYLDREKTEHKGEVLRMTRFWL